MKKSVFLFTVSRILSDFFAIFLACLCAYFLRMQFFVIFDLSAPTTLFPFSAFCFFALKISIFLIIIFSTNGRYRFGEDEKILDEVLHIFWAFSSGMALLLVGFFFAKFYFFSRFIFLATWALGMIFLLLGRSFLRILRQNFYEFGFGRIKILILANGKVGREVINFLIKDPSYEIIGILTEMPSKNKTIAQIPVFGVFDDLEKILKGFPIDEILLASEKSSEKITEKLVRIAHIFHKKFRFLPDELALDLAAVRISTLGEFPIITLENTKIDGWSLISKKIFDTILAFLALIVLSPLFLWIAFKIRQEDQGAIFYVSQRVGKNGRFFPCFKFRTMVRDADKLKKKLKNERKGGVLFKIKNDPRITKFGKFLRTWSFDEFPQFFNVLRGEMSLIGPRPHLPEEVRKYKKDDHRVLSICPGITGFAQIHGRSSLNFEEEMNYELFYLKNWTFLLDLMIFFKTIFLVLKKENAD
jgi:exopolysaccharide biosynthesis polyprenyl glycosylphosphotransferase